MVVTLKRPYFSLIIGAMASECKRQTMKSEGHGRKFVQHLPYLRPYVRPSVRPFVKFLHKP